MLLGLAPFHSSSVPQNSGQRMPRHENGTNALPLLRVLNARKGEIIMRRFSPKIARLMDMLPGFQRRFEAAGDTYGALRSDRHMNATRSEWYTFHHFHLDPMFFVLDECLVPGRKLKREPRVLNGKSRYGLDVDGRMMFGETYNAFPGRCGEEFWVYGDGWIDSTLFSDQPVKDCINVARLFMDDGRADAYVKFAVSGIQLLSYEWKAGLIVRVEECRSGFSRHPEERPLDHVAYEIQYLDQKPSSVRKTVTTTDEVTEYLISHGVAGRKKASVLKSTDGSEKMAG
jgi:hypothetical protein